MATLSTEDRERITRGIMSYWSSLWEVAALSVQDLQAAVNATDAWIEDNQVAYTQALPTAARDNLTQPQKTLLFCVVALARVSIDFLKRIVGRVD